MKRRRVLFLLEASLLLGLVSCSRKAPPAPVSHHSAEDLRKLTVTEVAERIDTHDGKLAIFDCNSKEQFNGAHLPGAKWVDFHGVTAADLPPDKTTALVFYCREEL
jgi:Rhodanese-like domain